MTAVWIELLIDGETRRHCVFWVPCEEVILILSRSDIEWLREMNILLEEVNDAV